MDYLMIGLLILIAGLIPGHRHKFDLPKTKKRLVAAGLLFVLLVFLSIAAAGS